jgi:hypothetical protein
VKIPLLAFLLVFLFSTGAMAWEIHDSYDSKVLKIFKGPNHEKLILERATVSDFLPKDLERIQIRKESGRIIAYTSTRVTGLPFCLGMHSCWVFMWKTVYPLPAIYKFNPDPDTWTRDSNPPMQYSRNGNWGEGFDAKLNPLFGLFGVLLLLKEKAAYFCGCILFTIILCLQITKYRDLPETHQKWIRRVLAMIFSIHSVPFLIEPYRITAILIGLFAVFVGTYRMGVPHVISIVVIFSTFILCAMRLARIKLNKSSQLK